MTAAKGKILAAFVAGLVFAHPGTMVAIADGAIEATLLLPGHILVGEPLPVVVRVRNTSDRSRPIILPDIGRFSRKKIVFSLEKPGTSNFVDIAYPDIYVGGIPMLSSIPYAVRHLDTGEAIECGFSLVYDFCDERRHQRLFDVPGKYRIRVSVFEPLGIGDDEEIINNGFKWRAIQSEAAQVEVRMPEGDRDRRALEAFDTLPCEYSVYAPLFVDNLAITPLQSFFHEYGDTRLGHRTALPLGVAVANGQVRDGKHGILEALMTLRQGGDAEMSEMASAVVAQFPQLDPSFPHAYYVEKPVETFIDVIRAADTTGADSAALRLGRLTTAQKALLLLLCERAETTITNRLFCFQQPGASQSGRNWRMDIPSERIAWLLCGTFGLEDGKFQRRRGEVDDDSWFRDIVRECVDALAALRKEEEDRLPGRNEYLLYLLRRHMLAADAGERQGLPRNGRSETALTALATNAANNIRLAVAPNGGTPPELLAGMVAQVLVADQDRRHLDLIANLFAEMWPFRREADCRELFLWMASRLCDLRSLHAAGETPVPPGHDLSLIGGKCAYLLEKLLGNLLDDKLVPVRRDTPIDTLKEQRERLIRRIGNL